MIEWWWRRDYTSNNHVTLSRQHRFVYRLNPNFVVHVCYGGDNQQHKYEHIIFATKNWLAVIHLTPETQCVVVQLDVHSQCPAGASRHTTSSTRWNTFVQGVTMDTRMELSQYVTRICSFIWACAAVWLLLLLLLLLLLQVRLSASSTGNTIEGGVWLHDVDLHWTMTTVSSARIAIRSNDSLLWSLSYSSGHLK